MLIIYQKIKKIKEMLYSKKNKSSVLLLRVGIYLGYYQASLAHKEKTRCIDRPLSRMLPFQAPFWMNVFHI